MKRLIIDGDWKDSGGTWTLLTTDGWLAAEVNPERCTVTVEDIPDPLPTTPGERFWGRSDSLGPQWWFVAASNSCSPEDAEVDYICAAGLRMSSLVAEKSHGLVRLPDPEATP